MADGIIIGILFVTFYLLLRYITKEKAKGHKCIGCPYSGTCQKNCEEKCSGTAENLSITGQN